MFLGIYTTVAGVLLNVSNCTYIATGALTYNNFCFCNGAGTVFTFRDCVANTVGGTNATYGSAVFGAGTGSIILYNCNVTCTEDAGGGALMAYNGGYLKAYNCVIDGSGAYDVARTLGTLTLYDCTLVNNTALGTITYAGTVRTKGLVGTGIFAGIPDPITATSEGVAASVDTLNTEVTTNGDSDLDNVTLANGYSGQIKHIYCVAAGNVADSFKITPTNACGFTNITFGADPTGKGCTLVYADSEGWTITGQIGGTVSEIPPPGIAEGTAIDTGVVSWRTCNGSGCVVNGHLAFELPTGQIVYVPYINDVTP